jgi:hypothetical protein
MGGKAVVEVRGLPPIPGCPSPTIPLLSRAADYTRDTESPERGLSNSTHIRDNHIYDTAATGRVDLNRFWNVKVDGHFN